MTKEKSTLDKPKHWSERYRGIYFYLKKDDQLNYVYDRIPHRHEWFRKCLTTYAQKHPEIFEE